jgi:SHAQKYF class myb-like DNA-binding protein
MQQTINIAKTTGNALSSIFLPGALPTFTKPIETKQVPMEKVNSESKNGSGDIVSLLDIALRPIIKRRKKACDIDDIEGVRKQNEDSSLYNSGKWTTEEQKNFLLGLKKYGKNWIKIGRLVSTRDGYQIRSHAQKHFKRIEKVKSDTSSFADAARTESKEESKPVPAPAVQQITYTSPIKSAFQQINTVTPKIQAMPVPARPVMMRVVPTYTVKIPMRVLSNGQIVPFFFPNGGVPMPQYMRNPFAPRLA